MDLKDLIDYARENGVSEIKITLSSTKTEEIEYVYEDSPMQPIRPLDEDEYEDEEDE